MLTGSVVTVGIGSCPSWSLNLIIFKNTKDMQFILKSGVLTAVDQYPIKEILVIIKKIEHTAH